MARHGLTDEQWERMEDLFPRNGQKAGPPWNDHRRMIEACCGFWPPGRASASEALSPRTAGRHTSTRLRSAQRSMRFSPAIFAPRAMAMRPVRATSLMP